MQVGWQLKSIQVPAAQEVHAVAPALLYEPAKQQTHVVSEEAPRAMLYLPAAQFVQEEEHVMVAYLPAAQATQLLNVAHANDDVVPAGQQLHAAATRAELHDPNAQQKHWAALVAPVVVP